ncbi:MAG: hypothetical protein WC956_10255 [bacterium]
MKRTICIAVGLAYLFATSTCLAYEAQCLNTDGKFTDCKAEINEGALSIHYSGKKWQGLDKVIDGKQIMSLTGGEYARRRVAESIGSAVLLGPLFLFVLFSKKKRDNFGIEYAAANGSRDSVLVQMKKKYGFAFGQQLKTISGKDIQIEGSEPPKDKQAPVTENAQRDTSSLTAGTEAAVVDQQAGPADAAGEVAEMASEQRADVAVDSASKNETRVAHRKHR